MPAILEAFYPGQEGGNALADILFGNVSPAGRLPLTFPHRWEDSPVYATYPGSREVAHYKEGIFVGYRHFDKEGIEPLFPFGHGLSYTKFEYGELSIRPDRDPPRRQRNRATGCHQQRADGRRRSSTALPPRRGSKRRARAKGVEGICPHPFDTGRKKGYNFRLDQNALSFYDAVRGEWVAEAGKFEVLIGSSSRDIRLKGSFQLDSP